MSKAPQVEIDALHRAVLAAHPSDQVAAIYLFGSHARGTSDQESDVDLGVVLRRRRPPGAPASSEERAHLEALADRLSAAVGALGTETVDVVDLRAQGPLFAREALDGAVLLFEGDREARVDFVAQTLVRAIDFEPTFEIAMHDRAARMRAALRRDGRLGRRA